MWGLPGYRRLGRLHAFSGGLCLGIAVGLPAAAWSADDLPVAAGNFQQSGAATYTRTAGTGVIQQTTNRATLNWQSFNIGRGNSVRFEQPGVDSVAINKIYQIDPSRINGSLSANGKIYLINPNGIIFGDGARVNVGALVASTLGLREDLFESAGLLEAIENKEAIFEAGAGLEAFKEIAGRELPEELGVIAVAPGARITSDPNGYVMLIGSAVSNDGEIRTPDGQAILAASNSKVYLAKPGDAEAARLVGMLVEVDPEDLPPEVRDAFERQNGIQMGQVKNGGTIEAERGNVTLMGMAVNQEGRIRATTAVDVGGSIRLVAREVSTEAGEDATFSQVNGRLIADPKRFGEVVIGEESVTEVVPDLGDRATAVDGNVQMPSRVEVVGKRIEVGDRARITAKGGEIEMIATTQYESAGSVLPGQFTADKLPGQLQEQGVEGVAVEIGENAVFDASGTDRADWLAWVEARPEDAELENPLEFEMSRNLLETKVLGFELRDSPLQRNEALNPGAVLNGLEVVFDQRDAPDIADVQAAYDGIERTVAERSAVGGSISIKSAGVLNSGEGTVFDVSGGSVEYRDGYINTTQLAAGNRLYEIAEAPKDIIYDRALNPGEAGYGTRLAGHFERGYVEGKDAGSVELHGNSLDSAVYGEVVGNVTVGAHQRKPSSAAGGLARPYDQAPMGGSLTLGRSRELYAAGDGARVRLFREADLAGASLVAEGIRQMDITAGERFQVPAGEALVLRAGGTYRFKAPLMEIRGDVEAPAGDVAFRAGDPLEGNGRFQLGQSRLEVAEGVKVDVSGLWINDIGSPELALPPLYTSAGRIETAAEGDLLLGENSLLRANAGGHVARDGDFTPGSAGDIEVAVDYGLERKRLELSGGFEAYGFGGSDGSGLTLVAPGFRVDPGDGGQRGTPEGEENRVVLDDSFFSAGGFTEYGLTSTHDGIEVTDGVLIDLDPLIMQAVSPARAASGIDPTTRFTLAQGDGFYAPATRLRLAQRANGRRALQDALVHIREGAQIRTTTTRTEDLGGCLGGSTDCSGIRLESDTSILVEGKLRAPGGSIALNTVKAFSDSLDKFHPEQGIWLGPEAELDVSAASRTFAVGEQTAGELYDAGEISLLADRGFIVAQPGSLLRLQGATEKIDLPGGDPLAARLRDGSLEQAAGGEVQLESPEGVLFFADLEAGVPGGNTQAGGGLTLLLDPNKRSSDPKNGRFFPEVPVELRLGEQQWADLGIDGAMQAVPEALRGVALLDSNRLAGSGIDSLRLAARPRKTRALQPLGASLLFQGDVNLDLARELVLDVQAVASDGGSVSLSAPYVSLGADNRAFRLDSEAFPQATAGEGRLEVSADLLDLVGDLAFQGFGGEGEGGKAPIHLSATEDIRLRGSRVEKRDLNDPNINQLVQGRLSAATDLTLEAAKAIYATTLSDYSLSLDSGTLTFAGGEPGGRPARLSAGASLRVEADHIVQDGTLLVPFGSLEFEGRESLTLTPGSLTSVSGAGLEVPFGTIGIEGTWLYDFGEDATVLAAAPEKRIVLSAQDEAIQEGARIDISGGGSLEASRFLFGPGGSADLLSNAESNGAFAIVPALESGYAPWDPALSPDFGYGIGTRIEIAGASELGIADGWYVVLPARYARQPGGFLVTPTDSAARDRRPGQVITGDDGVPVVTGRFGIQGTDQRDNAWSAFRVENADQFGRRAEYRVTDADSFFSGQAVADGTPVPALARDAGYLLFDPSRSLLLEGQLIASNREGAAPRVDITGERIAILDRLDERTDEEGRIELQASTLQAFGADSLLIGGRRSVTGDRTAVDVVSSEVRVEDNNGGGLRLELPELLLAASEKIEIGDGVDLSGSAGGLSGSHRVVHTPDDAERDVALLALSGRELQGFDGFSVGEDKGAVLKLAPGASVSATGTLALLAGNRVDLQGELALPEEGSLILGSSTVAVGANADERAGEALALNADRLAGLAGRRLHIRSNRFEVQGRTELSASGLDLDTAGILAVSGGDGAESARFNVDGTLTLSNSSGSALDSAPSSMERLEIEAGEILFGEGRVQVEGFAATQLETGTLYAASAEGDGKSELAVAGDLAVRADLITLDGASEFDITAEGDLVVSASRGENSLPEGLSLGGAIGLTGRSVNLDTQVLLPSGRLSIAATGNGPDADTVVGENAQILLQGMALYFDDVAVGTSGGLLEVSSAHGDVVFDNPTVDVSGAGAEGHAGEIEVRAENGAFRIGENSVLQGAAAEGRRQGEFDLHAYSLHGGLSRLNSRLQGGFGESRKVRVQSGDLNLAAGETLAAREIKLVTESGNIGIEGTLDAQGKKAGRVELLAGGDIDLDAGGRILATPTGAEERGGKVLLETAEGALRVDGTIDVRGTLADDGSGEPVYESLPEAYSGLVRFTVPRGEDNGAAGLESLEGSITGAGRIELVGMRRYRATAEGRVEQLRQDGGGGTWGLDQVQGHNAEFMDAANLVGVAHRLELPSYGEGSLYHFMPGVEIGSEGDLTVDADIDSSGTLGGLDLFGWREGGEPGLLRLRAAGDLVLGSGSRPAVIGDGFDRAQEAALGTLEQGRLSQERSWVLELTGGADLGSVDPASTRGREGSVIVRDNTDVRTGTGDILIAAAEDVILEGNESKVYTAGMDAGGGAFTEAEGGEANDSSYNSTFLSVFMPGVAFADGGGDLRIEAEGNIVGNVDEQFANHWLLKLGRDADDLAGGGFSNSQQPGFVPTVWGVSFDRFAQAVGALGGGDVTLKAGGDIRHVSASLPTSGRQVGELQLVDQVTAYFNPELHENRVEELGGGDLEVRARGDIIGGNYYVQRGDAFIKAGGNAGVSDGTGRGGILLSLGDAAVEIEAGGGVSIDNVFNPHMVAQVEHQKHFFMGEWASGDNTRFLSYGDRTALAVKALRKNVRVAADSARILDLPDMFDTAADITNSLYPARLDAVAFSGSVQMDGQINLAPHDEGNLRLLAGDSVGGEDFGDDVILQSDLDPAAMPDWRYPQSEVAVLNAGFNQNNQGHATVSPYAYNDTPNEIIAASGDIEEIKLLLNKPSRIIAGRDIRDMEADIQHALDASQGDDFTLIQAGRDIRFTFERDPRGEVDPTGPPTRGFVISGDGSVQVIAGRDIDLGDSRGLLTIGNRTEFGEGVARGRIGNENLPDSGADINILAGLSTEADYGAFIQKYLLDEGNQPQRRLLTFSFPGGEVTQEDVNRLKALFGGDSEYWVLGTSLGGNSIALEVERKPGLPEEGDSPSFLRDVAAFAQSRQGSVVFSPVYDYRTLAWDYVARKLNDPNLTVNEAVAYLNERDPRESLDFLLDIFFSELVAGGQRAALEGNSDFFIRGSEAISTLFPTAPTPEATLLNGGVDGLPAWESVAQALAQNGTRDELQSLFGDVNWDQGSYDALIRHYLRGEANLPQRRLVTLEFPQNDLAQQDLDALKALFDGNSDYRVVGSSLDGNAMAVEVEKKAGADGGDGSPSFLSDLVAFAESRDGTIVVTPEYDYRTLAWDYAARQLNDPTLTLDEGIAYLAGTSGQQGTRDFLAELFFSELEAGGQLAALEGSPDALSRSQLAMDTLFPSASGVGEPLLEIDKATGLPTPESVAAIMAQSRFRGDVQSLFSRISTEDGGDVRVAIPGGNYIGGTVDVLTFDNGDPVPTGLVVPKEGNVLLMAANDLLVNSSKIINRSSGGNMALWSSLGNIDAGRGQRGARVETSPFDVSTTLGHRIPNDSPVVTGSGIQNLPAAGRVVGNTYLLTKLGVIDAGTAGIQAENITLVASQVRNAQALELGSVTSNLSIGAGPSAPVSAPDLGSVASQVAEAAMEDPSKSLGAAGAGEENEETSLAMLSVEVVGYGEEDEEDKKEAEGG